MIAFRLKREDVDIDWKLVIRFLGVRQVVLFLIAFM
jgi:hypothetical protein